jgi:aminoglycoside phosphotransferase (APT) family kinase protein
VDTLDGMAKALTREYSKRLGVLTAEQLDAALGCFDLGSVVDAEPAPHGLFGQNVMLESTRGRWVLRGFPHYDWRFPKERFLARLIHERTSLGSPWPYRIEESSEIFGWSFAIAPRLEGEPGIPEGEEAGRAYAEALGSGLGRLHELGWEEPGTYDHAIDSVRPYPVTQSQRVTGLIRERLRVCREVRPEATTEEDLEWAESLISANRAALDEPFEARFVHHDYKPNNVLALAEGDGWRVTGAVDLMEGYFADPEEDLVRTVSALAVGDRVRCSRFIDAYRARQSLRPGHAERYRLYQLLDCLVLWEYGQRNRVWFRPEQRFRGYAGFFVEKLRPFA